MLFRNIPGCGLAVLFQQPARAAILWEKIRPNFS
jgi:hypothetical protein